MKANIAFKTIMAIIFFTLSIGVGSVFATTSNAYISIEVKNIKKIYQDILKILGEKKIIPTGYSDYINSKNGKRSINISCQIPRDLILDFMSKIACLGDVKSQNYHERSNEVEDIESKVKMLEYYKSQMSNASANQNAIPEVINQLNYKIQNLEKEILEFEKQSQEDYEPKVALNIQIKEKGYENKGQIVTVNYIYFIGYLLSVCIFSLGLGFLWGWNMMRIKNKKMLGT
jgi:hypothetical protein